MQRLRGKPRASLAVAGILATPLFFVGLMVMSLAVEEPSVHYVLRHGKPVRTLGDPSGATEARIWLLAAAPAIALVLVGTGAMLLGRAAVIVTSLAAIALTSSLLVPLDGWASRHAARFPIGVDLIPPSAGSADVYLRGEWEGTARHTALQLGAATIGISLAAIAIVLLLLARRRRGPLAPPPPLPPEVAAGQSPVVSAGLSPEFREPRP